tara:strand:+ start:3816 stop:4043 length:228 start_codon:yes stop_codon:yes gene_type:complete
MQEEVDKNDSKPRFWTIVASTLAAFIGVQSNSNRIRDFKYGNIYSFIIAGIIFTIFFIICVVSIVQAVLNNSGFQ